MTTAFDIIMGRLAKTQIEKIAETRLKRFARQKKLSWREKRKYRKLFVEHEELKSLQRARSVIKSSCITAQERRVRKLKRALGIKRIPMATRKRRKR